jgi:hypothetical protein
MLISATYTGSVNFTIPDNSKIYGFVIPNTVTAVFQDLSISNTSTTASNFREVKVDSGGILNINSGTVLSTNFVALGTSGIILNNGTVNINDGTIQGDNNTRSAIYNNTTGTLNIAGGVIKSTSTSMGTGILNYGNITVSGDALISGTTYGIDAEGTTDAIVTINDGIVEATASGGNAILTRRMNITMKGGIVRSTNSTNDYGVIYIGGVSAGTIDISGGTVSCASTNLGTAALYIQQNGSTIISRTANIIGAKNGINIMAGNNAVTPSYSYHTSP